MTEERKMDERHQQQKEEEEQKMGTKLAQNQDEITRWREGIEEAVEREAAEKSTYRREL